MKHTYLTGKRILSLVMVIAMLLGLMPANVFAVGTYGEDNPSVVEPSQTPDVMPSAEGDVASVTVERTTTNYTDIGAALVAVEEAVAEGGTPDTVTLKLLQDVTVGAESLSGQYIPLRGFTLDLNGCTMKPSETMDSDMGGYYLGYRTANGNFVLTDTSADGDGVLNTGDDYFTVYTNSTAEIRGGKVARADSTAGSVFYVNGTLNVYDGQVLGSVQNIGGAVNVYGGTFSEPHSLLGNFLLKNDGTLNLQGGTFVNGITIQDADDNLINPENHLAQGHYFFDADGKQVTGDALATTTVTVFGLVASVTTADGTTTTYQTVKEATFAAAAQEGSTLKLLLDCTVDQHSGISGIDPISNGKNFTLDLNGKTLTAKSSNAIDWKDSTLTITDSSEAQTGTIDGIVRAGDDATILIMGGNFKGSAMVSAGCTMEIYGGTFTAEHAVAITYDDANLTIRGGTFQGGKSDIQFNAYVNGYTGTTAISGGTFPGGLQIVKDMGHEGDLPTISQVLAAGCTICQVSDDALVSTYATDWDTGTVDVYVNDNSEAMVTTADGQVTKYATVEEATAYAATQKNSTLKLLTDCTVEEEYGIAGKSPIRDGKDFTLDLNGKTLIRKHGDAIYWYDSTLTITDSSEAQTGTVEGEVIAGYAATIKIMSGNFKGYVAAAAGCGLEIYDGTFTGDDAVGIGYDDADLTIYGGTFQGRDSDIQFGAYFAGYTGTTTISGGTFPGGLQITQASFHRGDLPTISQLLAEGSSLWLENGSQLTTYADDHNSGTQTVTVGKLSDVEASVTVGTTTTQYLTVDHALAAANEAVAAGGTHETVTLKLLKDAAFGDESAIDNFYVNLNGFTLDLNGFTLRVHETKTYKFATTEGYTTVIRDSSENGTGKIRVNSFGYMVHKGATVNVYGGEVVGYDDTPWDVEGTMNIHGGKYVGSIEVLGTVNVYGGTFAHNSNTAFFVFTTPSIPGDAAASVTLYGGNFTNGIYIGTNNQADKTEDFLADGYFFLDADGNIVTGDALGSTAVTVTGPIEASVTTADGTTTRYATVEEATAYAATQENSTLKLLTDCAVEGSYGIAGGDPIKNGKTFTLDLNGKTLSTENGAEAIDWYNSTLIITDSSEAKTGTMNATVCAAYDATIIIMDGTFKKAAEVGGGSTMEIYGGTFTSEHAVRVAYNDANLYIYDGTFQGGTSDIQFNAYIGGYRGTTVISGGTFPGGLQIVKDTLHKGELPTISQLLADGCALWLENGSQLTTYTDEYTSGTETVTVGKLSDVEASVTVGETTTNYLDIDKALAAANEAVAAGGTPDTVTLKVLKDAAFGDESKHPQFSYVYLNGFTLDLNGFTLKAHESKNRFIGTESGYTTVIRDSSENGTGKLQPKGYYYAIPEGATVNVYGGEVVDWGSFRAWNVYGTMNIYGGKYSGSVDVGRTVNIYGGTFTGSGDDFYLMPNMDDAKVVLYGGTFENGITASGQSSDVEQWLAEGCYFLDASNTIITGDALETTTVTVTGPVEASVTTTAGVTTAYKTVEEATAYAATQENSTLKLLMDCTVEGTYGIAGTSPIENGKAFTLDLNGKTLTAKNPYAINWYSSTLIITDSSEAKTGTVDGGVKAGYYATVKIMGGNIKGRAEVSGGCTMEIHGGTFTGEHAVTVGYDDANLTIHGGTFQGSESDIRFDAYNDAYTGTTAISGGTFPGGLQIAKRMSHKGDLPTINQILATDHEVYQTSDDALVSTYATDWDTGTVDVYVSDGAEATVTTTGGVVTRYATVEEATNYAATQENSTLKLLRSCVVERDYGIAGNNPVRNGKTFTLDLNGKTLSTADGAEAVDWYNSTLIITDSSEAKTGTVNGVVSAGYYATIKIMGGNFNGSVVAAAGCALEISGGTFTGEHAVKIIYGTADLYISGGTFQGSNSDIYFNFYSGDYTGTTAISGGIFTGGLQISKTTTNEVPLPTVKEILADGYAYFTVAGSPVFPADDALTTGTDDVTVKKQVSLAISLDKDSYYSNEDMKITFTVGQESLSGRLTIFVDNMEVGSSNFYVGAGEPPLKSGHVYVLPMHMVNAGSREIYATFEPEDVTMERGQSNIVPFFVEKIPNDKLYEHFHAAVTLEIYDGRAKYARVNSLYREGESKFYLAPESYTLTYWLGETQVAEPINAGTYTVKITMAESEYYQAADNYPISTLVIEQNDLNKAMLDYTVPADGDYTGNAFVATATMKSHITAYGEMKLEYQKDGETERTTEAPIAPGTYAVIVSVTGGDNLRASETTLGSFTIRKAGVTQTSKLMLGEEEVTQVIYEDQVTLVTTLTGVATGAVPTGTIAMKNGETELGTFTLNNGQVNSALPALDAGTYTLSFTYSGDGNYSGTTWTMELTVEPRTVTLTPSGLEQIYDGTAKTITFTNSTKNLDMDDFTVTYYQVNENMGTISKVNRAVSIGRYLYVVELKEEHKTNYTFTNPITMDGDTLPEGTYDNAGFLDIVAGLPEAQEPIYFVEGAVTVYLVDGTYSGNTLVNPNNTIPTYTSSNPDVAEVAADGTVTLKRTGTVTIFATSQKEGTTPVRASYTLTIQKKDATITVNGLTTTYGEAFTLTADMLTITGCTLDDLDLTGLTYTGYTVGQGVGTYYITPAGITSETYDLTFAAGTLTVQPREIDAATITVTAAPKVYDGTTDADLTATLPEGAVLAGDKVTVTAEGAYTAATAGTTTVNITALTLEGKDADNYVLTGTAPATASGEITQATVTFTTASKTVSYDGYAKVLDINAQTNNGLTADYTVSYSTDDGSAPVLPGTYTVTVTLTDTVNYVADTTGLEGKTLTITAAQQQSFTVSGLEDGIRYGDVKTLTAENAQGEVTFTITEGTAATISGNEITAVGTGKVVITATSVKEGFEDKTVKITVTVGKRLITAEVGTITDRAYDGTVTVNATVNLVGVINNDTVTVSNVAEVQTPNVGTDKTVTIVLGELTGEDAALYELTTETLRGKVTITAREIDASQVTITAAGKIYDGTTDADLTATLPEGAVLPGDQVTITAEGAYTSANAGTTTVNITALTLGGADVRNYVLVGTAPATALGEITQATVTFTTASKTVSYDGYAKVLDINAQTNNGLTADYTVSYSTDDGSAPVLPGTYTVTVTLTDTVNYVADTTGLEGKTLTITAAQQQSFTVSGLEDGIRYGDVKTLTAENAQGEVTFTITEGTAATISGNEITAIGTGKVVITATSVKEGFENKTVKITVTVGKRLITAEVGTITDRAYDGTVTVNATVNLVGIINNDDVTPSGIIAEVMTPGAGENKTVSITVSGLTGEKAELYELTTTTLRGTVNITPKTVEAIAFTVADKYYDGTTTAEILGVTLTGILGSDQVTATARAEFSDPNAGENKTVTLTDVTLAGADARNYLFADTTTVTVNTPTIHKTLVTVFCPETTTCTYDGTAKTVYLNVLANGMAFTGYTLSYTMNGEAVEGLPINVGTYDVVITLHDSVNYELSPYSAKLVIEPATQDDLDIQGIPDRVCYGDSFAVSVPGTEGTVTWEITGAALENGTVTANEVGTITITATVKLANYKDQIITRTVTAYPRVLTATATATNRTYNGRNDVEVTISLGNVAFDDQVTATAQGQMATSDAGTDKLVYVSGITLSDTVHYTLETTTLQTSVDIARIVLNSITVTAMDKVYDGTDKADVTITGSADVLPGDEITITGTGRFASANAGKQTVTVTATGITGPKAQNYELAQNLTGTTQAEILPATVVFEVGTATFFYDGEAKAVEVTAKLDGKAFTDFTVSYDPADPTDVGTYTVTVTLNDSRNYTGAPAPFTMEILPADQERLVISGMPGVVDYGRVFTLTTNAHQLATVTWSTSDGTIATVDENGTVTIVDVDREVTITATATMANHNDATASVTFTPVAKQVTFRLGGLVTTYTGANQSITVEPSVEGMTDYTVTYTDEAGNVVTPNEAGTYFVEVRTTTNKYQGFATGTFTIRKATVTGELTVENWTYGQTPNQPQYLLTMGGIEPTYVYSGAGLKDGQPYGAGQYSVTATFQNPNFETLILTAEFEVYKAMLTVTATDAQRAYGESNPNFTVSVTGFAYGEDIYDLLVIPTATTTATMNSDVGTYPITAQGGRSENYDFTYAHGTLTIVPAEGVLTITGASDEVTIGQTLYLQAQLDNFRPQVIWSSSDETVATIDETGKVTVVGAGTVVITARLNEKNYVAEDASVTLTTTRKVISLQPKATVFTYNGTVQGVEFAETQGFVPVVGENVQVTYTMTTTAQNTELRNAGTYVAVYEITDPAYAGSGTFTVYMNKAERTLRPADLEKTYGEANPAFTIDPNGLLGEDVTDESYIARVNAMFDFTCEADEKSLEGTYTITMTLAEGHSLTEDPNYDFVISQEPGTLIIRSVTGSEDCPSAHFTDLDPDAWYHEAVDYVVGHGLMNGVSDTLFAPQSSATRGMIVTILYRLEGEPAEGENIFTDVTGEAWYAKAVAWAAEKGIVKGYEDGTFRPNQAITREEMATIMYRYAGYKGCDTQVSADLSGYGDLSQVSGWAMDAMVWANATGLIQGRSATELAPKDTATRVELATILMRLIEKVLK